MAICRYFQAGRCAYGNECRNEHPGELISKDFTVSGDTITADLTRERPLWKLSCYAPGRDPPAQLIDGKDVSPEELRFRAWELQGMEHQFAAEEAQLNATIDAQINNILSDINGAVRFMTDANKNKEGYRYKTPSEVQATPFGSATQPTSAFAPPASTFAVPSFGISATPPSTFGVQQQTPPFGQQVHNNLPAYSTFATKASAPAFGQPSMGLGSTPSFGQPAFGKPAFSQPAFGQPAFGVTAAPTGGATTTPAFGLPAFGNNSSTAPKFGVSQTQAFGVTPTQATPVFGKPAFGQPAFGQPVFGQTAQPFSGTAVQQPNVFSQQQPSTPTSSTFGVVNAFASPQQSANAFTQPQQQQNHFSQPIGGTFPSTTTKNAFGQPVHAFAQQPQQPPQSGFGGTPFQAQQQTSAFQGGGSFGNLLNPIIESKAPLATMGGAGAGTTRGAGASSGKWDDPPITYTLEELEAFRAPEFVLGKIPLVPPSQEMCR